MITEEINQGGRDCEIAHQTTDVEESDELERTRIRTFKPAEIMHLTG